MTAKDQETLRRRARTLVAAREARWTGVLFVVAGAAFELLGVSKGGTGLGIMIAGGLILTLGYVMLIVLRRRYPDDDPDDLVKILRGPPSPEQTTPPTPAAERPSRRRWHHVRIPAGSRYIDKGHANDLAEGRLLRRVGALTTAATAVGCGIAGLFLFDGKTYPVILIIVGLLASTIAAGFLVRLLLEISAEKDRDWPHL